MFFSLLHNLEAMLSKLVQAFLHFVWMFLLCFWFDNGYCLDTRLCIISFLLDSDDYSMFFRILFDEVFISGCDSLLKSARNYSNTLYKHK